MQFGAWHKKTGANWDNYMPTLKALGEYYQVITTGRLPQTLSAHTQAPYKGLCTHCIFLAEPCGRTLPV